MNPGTSERIEQLLHTDPADIGPVQHVELGPYVKPPIVMMIESTEPSVGERSLAAYLRDMWKEAAGTIWSEATDSRPTDEPFLPELEPQHPPSRAMRRGTAGQKSWGGRPR